ncbi:helix-turn-helix transcriptional regulator [Arcticibacter tournemirensis]|uniref:Helix-turn-helix transcriptional regulator n=1 Tax=Arcticibacter tournemirensis TaxID=699437 RepID=A0A5M9GT04_9SPHI|nr:helix-turn-helix transcriptional regulator [Arcticibacter tournemirensis]
MPSPIFEGKSTTCWEVNDLKCKFDLVFISTINLRINGKTKKGVLPFWTSRQFLLHFRWVKKVRNEQIIKALGQRVRDLRSDKKLSMEKLAELSGIDYRQLSYIELGQTDASLSTLYALCNGLNISLTELMDINTLK